jgi:hypothetical protein
MFAERLNTAIETASLNQLDHLARTLWQGHATGAIADVDAQGLAETIEARRAAARAAHKPVGIPLGRASMFPPKRVQRSPDRARSIERRRTLAASGPMPPHLACRFTTGELAVLRIVADAVLTNGQCVLPVDAIAARAGVCRTTAQNAIRQAGREGLLTIQERRREGRRNDYNVVRVISAEWLSWIKRGGGFKRNSPTDTRTCFQEKRPAAGAQHTLSASARAAPGVNKEWENEERTGTTAPKSGQL